MTICLQTLIAAFGLRVYPSPFDLFDCLSLLPTLDCFGYSLPAVYVLSLIRSIGSDPVLA